MLWTCYNYKLHWVTIQFARSCLPLHWPHSSYPSPRPHKCKKHHNQIITNTPPPKKTPKQTKNPTTKSIKLPVIWHCCTHGSIHKVHREYLIKRTFSCLNAHCFSSLRFVGNHLCTAFIRARHRVFIWAVLFWPLNQYTRDTLICSVKGTRGESISSICNTFIQTYLTKSEHNELSWHVTVWQSVTVRLFVTDIF